MSNNQAHDEIGKHKWYRESLELCAIEVWRNTDYPLFAVRELIKADMKERERELRRKIEAAKALKLEHERSLSQYIAELEAVKAALGGAS